MQTHAEQPKDKETVAGSQSRQTLNQQSAAFFLDNRPVAATQRGMQEAINNSPRMQQAAQLQAAINNSPRVQPLPQLVNNTGLPDQLKAGVENLSGYSLDDVQVHYNSDKPAQLQAHAYAQGTDIHVAPSQEHHLPHEAWHVVQQKQGRVQSTAQMATGVALNDDAGLEAEAKAQGAQSARLAGTWTAEPLQRRPLPTATQPFRQQVAQRRSRSLVALHTTPTAVAAAPTAEVVQRVATQIETAPQESGEPLITGVAIRGRPAAVYGNSMGDHTTAFIVHVEGLNVNLQGQTVTQALDFMRELAAHLSELPGYESLLVSTENPTIRNRYRTAEHLLTTHLAQAATAPAQVQLHLLQEAIDAYLEARELIPFSTINVGQKSKGRAGKGHGESGPAGILSSAELQLRADAQQNSQQSQDPEELSDGEAPEVDTPGVVNAIHKLFDFQSASMLATEVDKTQRTRMTGGVTLAGPPSASASSGPANPATWHLQQMWQQHRLTIASLYPNVYKQVEDELGDEHLEKVAQDAMKRDFANLDKDATNDLAKLTRKYELLKTEGADLLHRSRIPEARADRLADLYHDQQLLMNIIDQMNVLDGLMKGGFKSQILRHRIGIQEYLDKEADLPQYNPSRPSHAENMAMALGESAGRAIISQDETGTVLNADEIKRLGAYGAVKTGSPLKRYFGLDVEAQKKFKEQPKKRSRTQATSKGLTAQQPEKILADEENHEAPPATLTSGLQPMAVQVLLNKEGVVTGMRTGGRPASPLSGTMGAHSTAWVAHLDRVRARIRGRDIPAAYASLQELTDNIERFYAGQQDKSMGNKAQDTIELAQEWMQELRQAAGPYDLSTVQRFIEAILSFYNLIPGVAREKIDTTGKGEGTYRGHLLAYETRRTGTRELIQAAINGLYDGRDRGNAMWINHLQVIQEAYPAAHYLVYGGTKPPEPSTSTDSELEAFQEEEQDQEEIVQPHPLSFEQVEAMRREIIEDPQLLTHQNNCLINAIAEANGIPVTTDIIINIRAEIGARLGTMLAADTATLNSIVHHLNVITGVVVVYQGQEDIDETSALSGAPTYIYHDGINHFTPLSTLNPGNSNSTKNQPTKWKVKGKDKMQYVRLLASEDFMEEDTEEKQEEEPEEDTEEEPKSSKKQKL